MSFLPRRTCVVLLGVGLLFPLASGAQAQTASSPAPTSALNEQQMAGKKLFIQNCGLCHLPEPENPKDPSDQGTSVGPRLEGLFNAPRSRPEAVVRTLIQQGVEGKMPGFRYGLEPPQIDAIVAYLKTL